MNGMTATSWLGNTAAWPAVSCVGSWDDVFMLGGSWKTSMDDGQGLNTMTLTGPGQVRLPT